MQALTSDVSSVAKQLGAVVRHRRNLARLSQSQLAERASISVEFVGRIERGEKMPNLGSLVALANALDVPVRDLFGVGEYTAAKGSASLERLLLTLSRLDQSDLAWVERLTDVALSRKPARPSADKG